MLYSKKMTKSHNSCKTCNIAKSCLYGHLHVMLVTVCGYEQNPSRGVGGVAHTRIWVVRTDRRTSGEVQILMPKYNFVGGHKKHTRIMWGLLVTGSYKVKRL